MADLDFEARLEKLFAQPPAFADAEVFALRVETRLDRGWSLRQVLIGGFGVAGGLIGAGQMLSSGLFFQFEAVSERSGRAFAQGFDDVWKMGENLSGVPISGEVLWMAAALGVMALAFAVTRAVEEF